MHFWESRVSGISGVSCHKFLCLVIGLLTIIKRGRQFNAMDGHFGIEGLTG